MTETVLTSTLAAQVKAYLIQSELETTPGNVARALRSVGRNVGDATVLDVYEYPHSVPTVRKFLVNINPDDSIDITWDSPTPADPENRDAAILERESVASTTLLHMMRAIQGGAR